MQSKDEKWLVNDLDINIQYLMRRISIVLNFINDVKKQDAELIEPLARSVGILQEARLKELAWLETKKK